MKLARRINEVRGARRGKRVAQSQHAARHDAPARRCCEKAAGRGRKACVAWRLPQQRLAIARSLEAEQAHALLSFCRVMPACSARFGCEPAKLELRSRYWKTQLVREQEEARFDPQNVRGGEPRRTRMAGKRRPDHVTRGARQDNFEAAFAGVAEASDKAGHPGNVRPHMRKIWQGSKLRC